MKFQLYQQRDGTFESLVFDETKMIPDPAYARKQRWAPDPPFTPRQDGESEEDFTKRETEHAAAVVAHRENIEVEAQRLYQYEFSESTEPELVTDKQL